MAVSVLQPGSGGKAGPRVGVTLLTRARVAGGRAVGGLEPNK